jgi:hypothetical protein
VTVGSTINDLAGQHPAVVFNAGGLAPSAFAYRIWYWTGAPGVGDPTVCRTAYSNDGLNWVNDQPIAQAGGGQELTDGISPGFFYQLWGPGCVVYNSAPTSTSGCPLSYPYAMYYDIAADGFGPGSSVGATGLAYSADGLLWTRYGNYPVLIPKGSGPSPPGLTRESSFGWDDGYIFRASLVSDGTLFHLFHTGSNLNFNNNVNDVVYAHGIGHAVSRDGVTWSEDWSNPLFYYNNGQARRNSRTYAPSVVYHAGTRKWEMWFSGGTGSVAGTNGAIGYASAVS